MPNVIVPQVPKKVREVVTQTWQSEASLRLFLALLVLFVFVLPTLGLERRRLYTVLASSLVLICGVAIAWRRRTVFLLASGIAVVTLALKWAEVLAPAVVLGIW